MPSASWKPCELAPRDRERSQANTGAAGPFHAGGRESPSPSGRGVWGEGTDQVSAHERGNASTSAPSPPAPLPRGEGSMPASPSPPGQREMMGAGMNVLGAELRKRLERTIAGAREVAEAGARAALEALAVHLREPYEHMSAEERSLRRRLRAHGRQLGDRLDRRSGTQSIVWYTNAPTSGGMGCCSRDSSRRTIC